MAVSGEDRAGEAEGVAAAERVGIDELLERVRAGYERIEPHEAAAAAEDGALLVDIRYAALRDRDGLIPGALVVERNELEWRLDPQGSHRAAEAVSHDLPVVVICNEGYASSLAVASLRRLGLHRTTDLIGGFQAWRAAGLPVAPASDTDAGSDASTDASTGSGSEDRAENSSDTGG
ncbi:rhodanese-like domain-containing protein [Streptomyces sp. NPDC088755]|uniref:rhodanese-like domain-containing protein n=1 Tax=Streptomyces sp. NPDC088755 TaxID=3365888 RepID=UPI00382ECAA9